MDGITVSIPKHLMKLRAKSVYTMPSFGTLRRHGGAGPPVPDGPGGAGGGIGTSAVKHAAAGHAKSFQGR